jgi:hypothetical protein
VFFPWLNINFGTCTLQPGQSIALPVTASAGSMTPGLYSGGINFIWRPNNTVLIVNVTFTVTGNLVPGITTGIAVSSNALNFTWVTGNPKPNAQTVIISDQVGNTPIPITLAGEPI